MAELFLRTYYPSPSTVLQSAKLDSIFGQAYLFQVITFSLLRRLIVLECLSLKLWTQFVVFYFLGFQNVPFFTNLLISFPILLIYQSAKECTIVSPRHTNNPFSSLRGANNLPFVLCAHSNKPMLIIPIQDGFIQLFLKS